MKSIILTIVLCLLSGCSAYKVSKKIADSNLEDVKKSTIVISDNIKDVTENIRINNEEIKVIAPETVQQTSKIDDSIVVLQRIDVQLSELTTNLQTETKRLEAYDKDYNKVQKDYSNVQKDYSKAKEKIADMEKSQYGLMAKTLAVISGLSIIGAVFCGFVLRSVSLSVACMVLFSLCIAGQWLINHAIIIVCVTLGILVIGALYIIFVERKGMKEVVQGVEKIKPFVDPAVLKEKFKETQSSTTERLVNIIQGKRKTK